MKFNSLPEINSISDMLFDPVWAAKYHQNNYDEILHVIKGKVELTYENGTKCKAGPGETLLNKAGSVHKDVFGLNEELEIFFISFTWQHSKDFFNVINAPLAKLSNETEVEVRKIFDTMRLDTGTDETARTLANSRLINILLLIYRDAVSVNKSEPGNSKSKHKQLVAQAQKYINRFFREPLTLENVAEHLQVSPFYLSRIFSKESDFSLIEYLTETRMNEAKKLLSSGRYIIADIAKMVGYEDSNYFSKVFKRQTGCSPCKYQ